VQDDSARVIDYESLVRRGLAVPDPYHFWPLLYVLVPAMEAMRSASSPIS